MSSSTSTPRSRRSRASRPPLRRRARRRRRGRSRSRAGSAPRPDTAWSRTSRRSTRTATPTARPSATASTRQASIRTISGPKTPSFIETLSIPTPFPVGPVNVHVILRDPITLIDSGPLTDLAWDALGAGLKRCGLEVSDVKQVLLTHGHQDRYGLAEKVADASGATLYGGRLDRHNFRQERNPRLLLDDMARGGFGVLTRFAVMASVSGVDRFAKPLEMWDELSGGETLPGDGWSVVVRSTPGHTPGSLTYAIPEAGVVFTGDTVLKEITPNAVVDEDPEEPGRPFRSVTRYFETLAKGPATVRDLVAAIFPRVKTLNVFLAYSEFLGFLMYLEDAGRVEKLASSTRDHYRLLTHGS